MIHKQPVHISDPSIFLSFRNHLTIVRSHNTTTQWTLNSKKPEFSLLSRLSVQTRKCQSDVLQRRTTSLEPLSVIEWRTVSRRSKNVIPNIIWPRSKRRHSYDIFSTWTRKDSRLESTTYEIWPIFFTRYVIRSLLTSSNYTTSYNVVLNSRCVFYVCTTFRKFSIKILIK